MFNEVGPPLQDEHESFQASARPGAEPAHQVTCPSDLQGRRGPIQRLLGRQLAVSLPGRLRFGAPS